MKTKEQLIAELLGSHKTIVDIGYAQTPNSYLRGMNIIGVDIATPSVPRNYTKTFKIDLNKQKLPFKTHTIDAVSMGCTLSHLENPVKVMREIRRILKKEGILVVSSPNPHYYWENVLNLFYHTFKQRVARIKHTEHFFDFTRYNMRALAAKTGFEVVKEIGNMFAIMKTSIRFNPIQFPSLAYEIIYKMI